MCLCSIKALQPIACFIITFFVMAEVDQCDNANGADEEAGNFATPAVFIQSNDEDLLSGSGMEIDKDARTTPMKIEPDGNQAAALVAPPVAGSPTNNDERASMQNEVEGNEVSLPSALSGSGITDAPVSGGGVVPPMNLELGRSQQPVLAAPPGALNPASPPGLHGRLLTRLGPIIFGGNH